MLKLLRGLDLSWQKTRPIHPEADSKAQGRFKNGLFPVPFNGSPKTRTNAGPKETVLGQVFCTPLPKGPGLLLPLELWHRPEAGTLRPRSLSSASGRGTTRGRERYLWRPASRLCRLKPQSAQKDQPLQGPEPAEVRHPS